MFSKPIEKDHCNHNIDLGDYDDFMQAKRSAMHILCIFEES